MSSERLPENRKVMFFFGFIIFSSFIIGLSMILMGAYGSENFPLWFLGILIPLGVIILSLIFLITFTVLKLRKERREDKNYIPDEPFLASFRRLFRKKQDDNLVEANYSAIPLTDRSYGRFGPNLDDQSNIDHQLDITIRDTTLGVSINSYLYDGKIRKEKCGICKLVLTSDDNIVQCSKCKNLFHKEHIESWLQTNKQCPICNFLFS